MPVAPERRSGLILKMNKKNYHQNSEEDFGCYRNKWFNSMKVVIWTCNGAYKICVVNSENMAARMCLTDICCLVYMNVCI